MFYSSVKNARARGHWYMNYEFGAKVLVRDCSYSKSLFVIQPLIYLPLTSQVESSDIVEVRHHRVDIDMPGHRLCVLYGGTPEH